MGVHLYVTHVLQPGCMALEKDLESGRLSRLRLYIFSTFGSFASTITMYMYCLIKVLWDRSLKQEHFVAWFRATGIFRLSREAIQRRKLVTSVLYQPRQLWPKFVGLLLLYTDCSTQETSGTAATASCSTGDTRSHMPN